MMDLSYMYKESKFRWRFGYCDVLIHKVVLHHPWNTNDAFGISVKSHIENCPICRKANLLRHIDCVVSTRLGPEVAERFMNGDGEPIRSINNYLPTFSEVIESMQKPLPSKLSKLVDEFSEAMNLKLSVPRFNNKEELREFLDWVYTLNPIERENEDWPGMADYATISINVN